MKTFRRVEVWLHAFITSALGGGEWSASRPSGMRALGTNWIGDWVGPRADLVEEVKRKISIIAPAAN
jgi:hypothetical protein